MHNNPLQDINPFFFPPSLPSSALYLSQSLSSSRCISSSIHCYPRQRRGCGQFARRKFQVRVCNGQAIIDYVRLKYNFNFPLGRLDIHQEILLSTQLRSFRRCLHGKWTMQFDYHSQVNQHGIRNASVDRPTHLRLKTFLIPLVDRRNGGSVRRFLLVHTSCRSGRIECG